MNFMWEYLQIHLITSSCHMNSTGKLEMSSQKATWELFGPSVPFLWKERGLYAAISIKPAAFRISACSFSEVSWIQNTYLHFQNEQRTHLSEGTCSRTPQSPRGTSASLQGCPGFGCSPESRELPTRRWHVWKGLQDGNGAEHVQSSAVLSQQRVFLLLPDMSVWALSRGSRCDVQTLCRIDEGRKLNWNGQQ